jgi:hypothetical protein
VDGHGDAAGDDSIKLIFISFISSGW